MNPINHSQRPFAIFLMGPTAMGKTDLAIALAKKYPIEIISVDSAMVYRGMDIGTGKPTLQERQGVPHHLLDIRDPKDSYSAADFARDALALMNEIADRKHIPLLVGGTLLYFRALQQGLSALPSADLSIRAKLLEEAKQIGWEAMHARLSMIDPQAAQRIHPNDPQRIQRALEVYEISGRAMSEFWDSSFGDREAAIKEGSSIASSATRSTRAIQDFEIQSFTLMPVERKSLHQRIEERFDHMLDNGLVAEVERLYSRGDLNVELPALRAVGYRQVWSYLEGNCTYEAMRNQAVAATRQLAKRQLTWLRSLGNVQPIPCLENNLQNNLLGSLETMLHFPAKGSLADL